MKSNKNRRQKIITMTSFAGLIIAVWCCKLVAHPSYAENKTVYNNISKSTAATFREIFVDNTAKNNSDSDHEVHKIKVPGINSKVLKLALKAYKNAKKSGVGSKDILTVVDYSLPSSTRRMWVIDLRNNKVLFHTYVSHGSGSGQNYATKFSNRPGSAMSSLGMFVTGKVYNGKHGFSLNMHGLEDKFNSNAYSRRIVVHGAHYADENVIPKIGRLGRSLGCLALNNKIAGKVMNTIKDGSYIFCYYPDTTWLSQSKLLIS